MTRDDFDLRPPHPLTPLTKTVIITDALRQVVDDEVVVTVVAAEHGGHKAESTDALIFDRVELFTYED